MKTPSTAAKIALPKMARNGGARRMDSTTSRTIGSRLISEMLNSPPRIACASLGSKAVAGGSAIRPMIAKPRIDRTMAGPDVHSMAPMCSWVVTPPTIDGTRTVVSEIGVILSPK